MKRFVFTLVFVLMLPLGAFAINLKTPAQDLYPKFFISSSGEMSGLLIDIMRAIENEVPNLRFIGKKSDDIEFVPWKRMQWWLEKGEIDVIFGIAKTEKRIKKGFIFIDIPLYTVNNIFAVRGDDDLQLNSFEDVEKLGDKGIILAIPGTATFRFLEKQKYNLRVDSGGQTAAQNFKKLLKGRCRFFFFHDLGILSTIKKEKYQGKIKTLPKVFRT
ncbi:MAG: transporter substrate-binding domain-containing protein [Desulfobacula sp.]|nr:transporter substrate-binding domain-containing protein [Desulfobacula sp.]